MERFLSSIARMALWQKFIIGIILSVLIFIFLSVKMVREIEQSYLRENLQRQNQKMFALLSSASIDALITEDIPILETILTQSGEKDAQIINILVSNEEDVVLAKYNRKNIETRFPPMVFEDKIDFEGETFGSITISWAMDKIYREIDTHVSGIRNYLIVFFLLFSTVILFVFYILVIRPLGKISESLKKINSGDYASQLDLKKTSEFIQLGDSVNRLSSALGQVNHEIYERKIAEEKYRSLLNAAPLAIIAVDLSLHIQSWNFTAEALFGWKREDALEKHISMIGVQRINDMENLDPEKSVGEFRLDTETTCKNKDGLVIDISLTTAPILNENNHVSGILNVIEDITEKIRSEEKLQQAYKTGMAETAISVLHNIGNAITPVVVNLELLQKSKRRQQFHKYLNSLHEVFHENLNKHTLEDYLELDSKGTEMLPFLKNMSEQIQTEKVKEEATIEDLIKNIHHITETIQLQKKYASFEAVEEVVDIVSLFDDVIRMKKTSLKNAGIKVVKEIDYPLPAIEIDRNKLVQTLLNFLKNAIDSLHEQMNLYQELEPVIKIIAYQKNDGIVFSISDNGRGASENILDKVFDFGFTTKAEGSGFGLHDCANFIRSNQGTIQFHSDGIGKGAEIQCFIP